MHAQVRSTTSPQSSAWPPLRKTRMPAPCPPAACSGPAQRQAPVAMQAAAMQRGFRGKQGRALCANVPARGCSQPEREAPHIHWHTMPSVHGTAPHRTWRSVRSCCPSCAAACCATASACRSDVSSPACASTRAARDACSERHCPCAACHTPSQHRSATLCCDKDRMLQHTGGPV